MKPQFLFPTWTRWLGLVLFFVHLPVMHIWDIYHIHSPDDGNLFNLSHLFFIATVVLMVTGLFLIAFSREKIEDEQIYQLRLSSLRWAIFANYLILIICLIFTNSKADYKDILRLNLWVPLVLFIILFRWKIFKLNRSLKAGE
jgi:cell division protein FtsW (lipid II flippase)